MTATPVLIEGWRLNKILGTGGFGIVELWIHTSDNKKLAIKKCKWDIMQLTKTQQKRWFNEVQIMKRLKHKNIIESLELPFKHPNDTTDLPIMCMEFCGRGDLRNVLNKTENCCGIIEKEAISVMKGISSAVEYLHSNNITHRDLKPENIVLQDECGNISYKLIDLGYAKSLGEASISASIVGTLNYVAPELLWKEKYSCSVDYWSLGILFYELVTGTRPFLPKMQHTITWMEHIKNKTYNDICAFELEGKVIFGQSIAYPTSLSRCLKNKLEDWFKVVLQWDPKRRGKVFNKHGEMELAVFKLLKTILSKQIVYVFCASKCQIYTYEVDGSTSVMDVQLMIEEDTKILKNQQTLTDYFGKPLITNKTSLLSQIQDLVLFVFKNKSISFHHIPAPYIPIPVQKMIELSRSQLDCETLKDYYRAAIFFITQEVYRFQLYIFALTIKVDLIIARLNTFNENIKNALTNINALLSELSVIRPEWEKKCVNKEKINILENELEKVIKLAKVTEKIELKFNPLMQDGNKLKNKAQCIDCIKYLTEIYDKAVKIFELCKNKNSHKSAKPTEMVKLMFEFLRVQGAQFNNENIADIIKHTATLEDELQTYGQIFNSVMVMMIAYRENLQNIMQCTFNCIPHVSNKEIHLNIPVNVHNKIKNSLINNEIATTSENNEIVTTSGNNEIATTSENNEIATTSRNNDAMEVSNEFVNHFSKMSVVRCNEDTSNDLIYDNLVLRYTLDNFLKQIQKKYMEMVSLEP